jgi:membrane glycosyltransferase
VAETGWLPHFDFFVLSDTTDPDLWIREEMAFHELREGVADPARLVYRNRRENRERKSGNIADFCARWGDRYRYMIVFDADSLMTGEAMLTLVRLMEKHPTVGIVQSPPVPVNRQSLFGRLMQFSARAYGPMFSKGLNFWQAGEGNYWGHNAIIRIQPFKARTSGGSALLPEEKRELLSDAESIQGLSRP